MKTIENKRTLIELTGNSGEIELLTYAQLMKSVMRRPHSAEGYTVDEMRKDFKVLDALENVDVEIKLEDADFEHFKSRLKVAKWTGVHRDLIQFEDDINAIK